MNETITKLIERAEILVGGNNFEYGNDKNEIIIEDPVFLWVKQNQENIMNYRDQLDREPERGDIIVVTTRSMSRDSGRTWYESCDVRFIDSDQDPFSRRTVNGPSESCGNLLKSGHYTQFCRRWTGSRWVEAT